MIVGLVGVIRRHLISAKLDQHVSSLFPLNVHDRIVALMPRQHVTIYLEATRGRPDYLIINIMNYL